jgi:hypothetical protein
MLFYFSVVEWFLGMDFLLFYIRRVFLMLLASCSRRCSCLLVVAPDSCPPAFCSSSLVYVCCAVLADPPTRAHDECTRVFRAQPLRGGPAPLPTRFLRPGT